MTPTGLPPHTLRLKLDCIVMLQRNMTIQLGFCNGTRLRIVKLMNHMVVGVDLKSNRTCLISRMPMTNTLEKYPFKLTRRQLGVRLSYAMTINKSQGQTLDRVGIYLKSPVFAHGQLYVACSRVRSWGSLRFLVNNTSTQGTLTLDPKQCFTSNIVYREILTQQLPPQPVIRLNVASQVQIDQARTVNNNYEDRVIYDDDGVMDPDEEELDQIISRNLEQRMIERSTQASSSLDEDLSQGISQVSISS